MNSAGLKEAHLAFGLPLCPRDMLAVDGFSAWRWIARAAPVCGERNRQKRERERIGRDAGAGRGLASAVLAVRRKAPVR